MKIAFMTFACPEWRLDRILATAAELGYDGLEPRIDAGHHHGLEVGLATEGRAGARRRVADAGIELCCLATSLQYIKVDPAARRALRDDTAERIALAVDLGIPGLRVFGGPVPEGVSLDDALAAAAENLHEAGEMAAEAGVELWVETHDTLSTAALCARVVDAAAHPAVHINYDVMHPYRNGEGLEASFAALGHHVRHTHWHDAIADPGVPEITPFGQGDLPLSEILARLHALGYDGYLSGEWFGDQLGPTPEVALRHYAEATRAMLAELG